MRIRGQNARREEMLVGRLLRQSQQERRIAVQLLQTRREKDAVQRSRQRHMAQCEERRRRELDEALNREAVSGRGERGGGGGEGEAAPHGAV